MLIANGIGWPVAYQLTGRWLQSFVYRAPQDMVPYLFVLVFVFLTVALLVTVQCLRTALDNPVRRLRAE